MKHHHTRIAVAATIAALGYATMARADIPTAMKTILDRPSAPGTVTRIKEPMSPEARKLAGNSMVAELSGYRLISAHEQQMAPVRRMVPTITRKPGEPLVKVKVPMNLGAAGLRYLGEAVSDPFNAHLIFLDALNRPVMLSFENFKEQGSRIFLFDEMQNARVHGTLPAALSFSQHGNEGFWTLHFVPPGDETIARLVVEDRIANGRPTLQAAEVVRLAEAILPTAPQAPNR